LYVRRRDAASATLAKRQEWTMKVCTMPALVLLSLALAPAAARADDEQQGRKACMYDALTVCAQFIPDRARIAECLLANRQRISEPCRALIVPARADEHPPAAR
jgi:hypothetical protein